MFTLLNTILMTIILIQIVKCRKDVQEIDCPAAAEVKKLRNRTRPINK